MTGATITLHRYKTLLNIQNLDECLTLFISFNEPIVKFFVLDKLSIIISNHQSKTNTSSPPWMSLYQFALE